MARSVLWLLAPAPALALNIQQYIPGLDTLTRVSVVTGVASASALLTDPIAPQADRLTDLGYALLPLALAYNVHEEWRRLHNALEATRRVVPQSSDAPAPAVAAMYDDGPFTASVCYPLEYDDAPAPAVAAMYDDGPFTASICYPLEYECDECVLNEELSEYYGQEIWLCA